MGRPSTGTKVAARSRNSSIALSTSASSILRSSISTSRSLYCPSSNSGSTSNVARNFTGPLSAKSTLSISRLRHRHHLVFGDRALDLLGHQRLQHFALDVVGEPAADQRHGRLPGTESRHARHAGKFPRHTFHRFLYCFRGNFQFQLAPASRFSHGRVFAYGNATYIVRLSRYIQNRPNIRTSTLCRFSVRKKETGKNCERGTTKPKYRGIHHRRQHAPARFEWKSREQAGRNFEGTDKVCAR